MGLGPRRDASRGRRPGLALATEVHGFFGRTTFEEAVTRFLGPDLLVHTWDLAGAGELDENLDLDEVERILDRYQLLPDASDALRRRLRHGDPRPEAPTPRQRCSPSPAAASNAAFVQLSRRASAP